MSRAKLDVMFRWGRLNGKVSGKLIYYEYLEIYQKKGDRVLCKDKAMYGS